MAVLCWGLSQLYISRGFDQFGSEHFISCSRLHALSLDAAIKSVNQVAIELRVTREKDEAAALQPNTG